MSRAAELINEIIRAPSKEEEWVKSASLTGRDLGFKGAWLSYSFRRSVDASRAADLAADLGLRHNWKSNIVQIHWKMR